MAKVISLQYTGYSYENDPLGKVENQPYAFHSPLKPACKGCNMLSIPGVTTASTWAAIAAAGQYPINPFE